MKILNLYCGIGGNRKLWGNDHEITAIELDGNIAAIYKDFYPDDNVIITDAHEYLLQNFKEYDFIWSSPPCPTHSDIRRCGVNGGIHEPLYPDMSLYQEIILLQNFANKETKWIIENVKPYYEPLIEGILIQRHLFWTNFQLSNIEKQDKRRHSNISGKKSVYGISLDKYSGIDKRKCLRNMVNPELASHILNCSIEQGYVEKTEQGKLF